MDRGEDVRKALRDRGVLLKHLKIRQEANQLCLPTIRRMDVGFPTDERDFEETFVAVRSYKDLVHVPERLRSSLPSSFDVIGDIAVIKIPEELLPHRREVAKAILAWNRKIQVVAQDHGVQGVHRVRRLEVLAGEARTMTTHVEYGLRYRADVARAYFSPRLATERLRVAEQVRAGEVVADPFAGVGPYAILIAKRRQPKVVHASDANPAAVDLLRHNVSGNRAERVEVREGDARTVLGVIAPVDRVILDLPHTAVDFLPDAAKALGSHGIVHVYGIVDQAEREERERNIRLAVEREGRHVESIDLHTVRAYSPTQRHVAFDVTVGPT
jgi:tRNA (guanine37-N1)-methyltransferase